MVDRTKFYPWRSMFHALPIIMDNNEIPLVDEPLHPIIWQGRQWAVTEYGIEARNGTYHIEKERLLEQPWEKHVPRKAWVDKADFLTALIVARWYYMAHGAPPDWDIEPGNQQFTERFDKMIKDLL